MKPVVKRALIGAGLSLLLAQGASAAGMDAPASLLPPGYAPQAAPADAAAPTAPAYDDPARSGFGEAELAPALAPMELPLAPAAPVANNYVDIPALAPLPQPPATSAYTQGITTGPKAYNEGNFTFKAK